MSLELSHDEFRSLARAYRRRWAVRLDACDPAGLVRWCVPHRRVRPDDPAQGVRAVAVTEANRWGDPSFHLAPRGQLLWAAPLHLNEQLLGGVVASAPEARAFAGTLDVRRAATELRELLESKNLANRALLAERRAQGHSEQARAQAIHELKLGAHFPMRRMYLLEEPTLIAAIRRGDRGTAREALNRLLVGVMHHAGSRLDLTRSFFMELVAGMTRTAVEAGGDPEALLGANYASLTELARLSDEEDLARWLQGMLERILSALTERPGTDNQVLLAHALRYMQEHCGESLTREQVAEQACMSPSHFSRQMRKHIGQGFSQVLSRMRIDRAAERLASTDQSLALIGLDCGFADQSYFTKVFRRIRGETPLDYRRRHRRTASP